MKVYFIDYIGIRSGVMYYIESFRDLVTEISDLETEVLSNYQPKDSNKVPFMINHYKGSKIYKISSFLKNLHRLKKFIQKNPDSLFIYEAYGTILDIFFLNIVSMTKYYVVDVHEAIAQNRESNVYLKKILKKIYSNKIKTAISHSNRTSSFLKDFDYRGTLFEVPHFKYQIDKMFNVDKVGDDIKNSIDAERINILMFGTITKEKGVDVLIESLNRLDKMVLNKINIIIAGRDYDGSCHSIKPNNNVNIKYILKYINDDELIFLFGKTQYMAMPYRKTSQSGVLEMAIFFNNPILASKIPYFQQLLIKFPSFGILSDSEDYSETIKKIFELNKEFYSEEELNRYNNRDEIYKFKDDFRDWIISQYTKEIIE